jgi:predicted metal-dependent peptidase
MTVVAPKPAFNLNMHTHRLLADEPFFAALSRHIDKRASTSVPTAGVMVTSEGRYEMVYNPDFMQRMVDECGETEENANKGQGESGDSSDDGDSGGGSGEQGDDQSGGGSGSFDDLDSFDSHEGWGEAEGGDEGTNQNIADERLKEMVKKAASEAASKGWGSVSAGMRQTILDSVTTKVDWRKVLRNFVKASQKSSRRSTIKRINRRFPYIHAGKRSERVARIAVSIDQSGSVSDKMLSAFFSELDSLAKLAEFVVVPFDTRVDESLVFTWKKGESRKWERVMCGGTDFDAPTRYVNEQGLDGHIILTDMAAPKPIPSKCRRMWMTDSYGATQPYFKTTEKVLEITT